MVAVSSSTVARSGVSMVAWTIGVVFILSNLVHASPSIKYGGDVTGDEVVIDQLEDYLRSHGEPQQLYDLDEGQPRYQQKLSEKIKFAVGPSDPRYFEPIVPAARAPVEGPSDPETRLRFLPPNLSVLRPGLDPQPQYPVEASQYQDEDVQYPGSQYVQDQYPDQYPFRDPGYVGRQEALPYYGNPRLEVMEDGPRELGPGSRQDPRAMLGLRQDDRDEAKRMFVHSEDRQEEEEEKEGVKGAAPSASKESDEGEKNKKAAVKATSQPEAVNYLNRSPAHAEKAGYVLEDVEPGSRLNDFYFTAIVAGCTAAAVCAVIGAGMCWYRLNKNHRAAQDTEYPAYGVTGPNKDLSPSSGDRKLAQSAHMYHYQHQKQQMIALEKSSGGERHGSASDVDSEEEGEENEYTVYECPGLAPTGEMEVKNPLFHDDPTPATPSVRKEQDDDDDEEDEEEEEQKAK